MFVSIKTRVPNPYLGPAVFPEGEEMLDLKWYVIGAGLLAFAMLLNYDLTFGLIAGGTMLAILAIRIGFWFWLAPERGEPDSERDALVGRFQRLSRNRRAARIKELGAKRGSDPRQGT